MKWTQHSVSIFTSKYRESVVLDFARFFEKIRNLRSTNGTVDHAGNPAARQELQIRCGGLISDVDSSSALGVAPNGVQRVPLPRTTCSNNKERTHSRYTHTHTAAHRISWQYKLMAGRQAGRAGGTAPLGARVDVEALPQLPRFVVEVQRLARSLQGCGQSTRPVSREARAIKCSCEQWWSE